MLVDCQLFAHLDQPLLDDIVLQLEQESYHRHSTVIEQGACTFPGIYFVQSGIVTVTEGKMIIPHIAHGSQTKCCISSALKQP